ncbi:MAG: SDR family NAD(P)-dependent oxidoreductase [Acidimicrobiales bacterium]|nr:SDR family NAD(P)-dependent oxidoreductase [Acidimicrobiales bacterium]
MSEMLEGKVAVVTGAGHGIGRGHALELARHGAWVVVNDLGSSVTGEGSSKDADLTVELIAARGGIAIPDYGDVADEAVAEAMVERAIGEWGRLDILVNNAGIVRDGAIWNLTTAAWDAVMGVHVRGPWLTSRAAARHWRSLDKAGRDSRGRIINTTSGAGLVGNFGQTNYATAKAAVVGLTLTLALELNRLGVTVNAIGPAGATRITGTMPNAPTVVEPDEIPEDSFHPLDPAGSSPVVAWLASDEAQYVTGQVIRVIGDHIHLMRGWQEGASASNAGKRWDATKVGDVIASQIFGTQGRGLQTWSR